MSLCLPLPDLNTSQIVYILPFIPNDNVEGMDIKCVADALTKLWWDLMLPVTSHFLYPTIITYPIPGHTSDHKGSGSHRVENVDPQIHLMVTMTKDWFHGLNGWHPPGLNGRQMPGLSGSRLQTREGRSMQPWVLVSCISWLRNPEHWNVHISQEFHFWNWYTCKVLVIQNCLI